MQVGLIYSDARLRSKRLLQPLAEGKESWAAGEQDPGPQPQGAAFSQQPDGAGTLICLQSLWRGALPGPDGKFGRPCETLNRDPS